tara:strand:- start:238 stop:480 length:243 start_codon:yes stop_codon:yes gene_type:complete
MIMAQLAMENTSKSVKTAWLMKDERATSSKMPPPKPFEVSDISSGWSSRAIRKRSNKSIPPWFMTVGWGVLIQLVHRRAQ